MDPAVDIDGQRGNGTDLGNRLRGSGQALETGDALARVDPLGPDLAALGVDHGDRSAAEVDGAGHEGGEVRGRRGGRDGHGGGLGEPAGAGVDGDQLAVRREACDRAAVLDDVERGAAGRVGLDPGVELAGCLVEPREAGVGRRRDPDTAVVEVGLVDGLPLGLHCEEGQARSRHRHGQRRGNPHLPVRHRTHQLLPLVLITDTGVEQCEVGLSDQPR